LAQAIYLEVGGWSPPFDHLSTGGLGLAMGSSPSAAKPAGASSAPRNAAAASEGLCPMAPSPLGRQEDEADLPPTPDKGAAMYWGESMMSVGPMMSSMFGAAPVSPVARGDTGSPPLETRMSLGLSPVPEHRATGVLDSISALLGTSTSTAPVQTRLASSSSAVETQLPADRTCVPGGGPSAFATQVPGDRRSGGGASQRGGADPMSTHRNDNGSMGGFGSTLFGSRLPMFSMVGRQDDSVEFGAPDGGHTFGATPMISRQNNEEPAKNDSILRMLPCCNAPPAVDA